MIRRLLVDKFAVFIVAAGLAWLSTHAIALEPPKGTVILVVSGNVGQANVGDEAHFDKAMLEALAQHETITHTPWYDGAVSFSGPLGRAILEAAGAEGESIRVVALNEYASTIPVSDFENYDVILAMQANGQALRVRDQGPLFVIYPFDQHPELLNEEILMRSVWQVARIDVE
ncbi:molybdopterin-dependent oxidoreductase [Halomonas sp. QX-2]|uniref:Molybdopterin-dependent oxidoreductase n=1 Tax=Vreelandella sedimenti TaxID=2729618 RepID=A0A7Z0N8H7_9GAMM|nr:MULTISPECIES: molybdopterin-dependent oxidoreductase [Halomonas]NYT73211.1 molybdopterin-dependent oxidoreductase [Halomonas sedimenti]|tara:strand:+ start:13399 stop:13917 length:519 start_codon:yes stop_codon:yes gene_type:complete